MFLEHTLLPHPDLTASTKSVAASSEVLQWYMGKFHTGSPVIHYIDVIMSAIASQITGVSIVYSTVCSGLDQRKHQSSASLAFVRGFHQWPVNSLQKGQQRETCFHFMTSSCDTDSPVIMRSSSDICMYVYSHDSSKKANNTIKYAYTIKYAFNSIYCYISSARNTILFLWK